MNTRANDGGGDGDCRTETERLERYGLAPETIESGQLSVPGRSVENGTVRLSRSDFGDRMVELKPDSIDEVKLWIGNENEHARQCCGHERAPRMAGSSAAADRLAELDGMDARAGLKQVAREYVYRNAEALKGWKPYLDELVTRMPPITLLPFTDIIVNSGSTLHVPKHVDVLYASDVRIEDGGRIVSEGDLKIDCLDIQGRV